MFEDNPLKKYVFLLVFLVCCSVPAVAATFKNRVVAPPSDSGTTVNKIVAVVNGERITMFDIERMARPDLMRRRINPNDPARRAEVDKVYQDVLDAQINDILIAQEAVRLKIEMGESEVDKEVNRLIQQSKMSPEDFAKQLQTEGMDMKELRDRIRKGLLRQRLLAQMVARKIIVNKDDVARYYAANKESMRAITEIRMAILVYPPNVNAEAVSQQIKTGKISFEDAVKRYSIDPATNKKGGEMAPAPWKDMSPDWRKRISVMKAGDVSDLFPIQQFKAQIKLLEKVGSDKERTLEEATPEIEGILREPLLQARFEEYTQWLRSRAIVDIRGL